MTAAGRFDELANRSSGQSVQALREVEPDRLLNGRAILMTGRPVGTGQRSSVVAMCPTP